MAVAMTFTCLTTTTYAWFARNKEAWTEEVDIEIENYGGLLISVDGVNFKASIDNLDIKRAIVAKAYGLNINDLTDPEAVEQRFKEMKFKDVTTKDLVTFNTINEHKKTDGYYEIIEANPINYYKFDLFFMIDAQGTQNEDFDLTFVSNSYKAEDNKDDDASGNARVPYIKSIPTKASVHSGFSVGAGEDKIDYAAGDKIDVDLKNAVRIGVIHDETRSGITIYEPYKGLGSYAIEGEDDKDYDPAYNYMLRHLEAYGGGLRPLPGEDKDIYKNTQKDFEGEVSFGRFTANDNKYNKLKLTICIWLEGYDSDYLSTVDDVSMSFGLTFCKKEVAA